MNYDKRKWNNKTVDAALRMKKEGHGYRKIGSELGVPWPTIRDWCKQKYRVKGELPPAAKRWLYGDRMDASSPSTKKAT